MTAPTPDAPDAAAEAAAARNHERDELLGLYRGAVEEYRFNVNLTWDRFKFFATINVAAVSVAGGLLKLDAPDRPGSYVAAVLFLMAALLCVAGAHAINMGHSYYREARDLFSRFEARLGLASDLRLSTTGGMRKRQEEGAGDAKDFARIVRSWTKPKVHTVVLLVLATFAAVDIVGAVYSCHLAGTAPPKAQNPARK